MQKALIRLGRVCYWEPERGNRWLSDMGNDVLISSLNHERGIGESQETKSLWGAEMAQVLGCRPITPTFHPRCWSAPGPCHLVLPGPAQVAAFTGHADRQLSPLLGSAVIRGLWPQISGYCYGCAAGHVIVYSCQNKPLSGNFTFYSVSHFSENSALLRIQGNASVERRQLYSP